MAIRTREAGSRPGRVRATAMQRDWGQEAYRSSPDGWLPGSRSTILAATRLTRQAAPPRGLPPLSS